MRRDVENMSTQSDHFSNTLKQLSLNPQRPNGDIIASRLPALINWIREENVFSMNSFFVAKGVPRDK